MTKFDKSKLPSRHVTEGPARAPHRSYYYAMGLTAEDIAKQMRAAHVRDWKEAVKKGVITQAEGERIAAAHEAVSKVIEVDDFAPEALSPIYKKPADVHQFFQELGEKRAAS